ncbi:MAG TPA: hypothetical protein DHW02_05425 [Ktedonobacter sp.]|nr:hypothetical protein [Ktedonobacter sp.]
MKTLSSQDSLFSRVPHPRRALYPPPEPMPRTRSFWIALSFVAFAMLAFSAFFIVFLVLKQNAYQTHAEDLGIMDQAIWNTIHGDVLHQTICNTIGDVNCVGPDGISRLAIHFEPILFPISLFYIFFPSPLTLLILQTLIVASGAIPAFLLARLRLRNDWIAAVIAFLYLLYPALHEAVIFDFHAVTLTAAFLLYMLYFMYTRRTVWLFVFAILAMACKEEVPLLVAVFGLWSIIFQLRWRSGAVLVILALLWTGVGLIVVHLASPVGHTPLTARYSYLGNSVVAIVLYILRHPVSILKQHVLETQHLYYLKTLFTPSGYLVVFSPWILVMAASTLAINLLSTDPQMYSGLYQYSAEIVPVLIFGTIESIALILWIIKKLFASGKLRTDSSRPRIKDISPFGRDESVPTSSASVYSRGSMASVARIAVIALLGVYVLFSVLRADYARGVLPFTQGFEWPSTSAHTTLAKTIIKNIPATASVSAQSSLVPHISHRKSVYLFPYQDTVADYVFLDVTSDIYPFYSSTDYINAAKGLILNGAYGVIEANDGYLLLKKGAPSIAVSPLSPVQPGDSDSDDLYVLPDLPEPFCSYVTASSVPHTQQPVSVTLYNQNSTTPDASMIGFQVSAPKTASIGKAYLSLTTYWRVDAPTNVPLQMLIIMVDKNGKEHLVSTDVPSVYWCQTNTWKPGMIMRVESRVFSLSNSKLIPGRANLGIALVPLTQPSSSLMDVSARYAMKVVHAPSTVKVLPQQNVLELFPMTLTA